jgi:hypothetical protein
VFPDTSDPVTDVLKLLFLFPLPAAVLMWGGW